MSKPGEFLFGMAIGAIVTFFIALFTGVIPLQKELARLEAEQDSLKNDSALTKCEGEYRELRAYINNWENEPYRRMWDRAWEYEEQHRPNGFSIGHTELRGFTHRLVWTAIYENAGKRFKIKRDILDSTLQPR